MAFFVLEFYVQPPTSVTHSRRGYLCLGASHSYSRWTDHSIHLCSKTVRATFMAHGSSVMRPLSSGICPAVKYSREDLRSDASCLPLAGHRSILFGTNFASSA